MKKIDEEFLIKTMIIVVSCLLFFLALNSLLSFLFWPSEALAWYDYIIEIIAYTILGSIVLLKRKTLIKKLV